MKILKYSFVVLTLLSFSLHAAETDYGVFLEGNIGSAEDGGEAQEQITGQTLGTSLGYRWTNWALSLGYQKFDLSADGGQSAGSGLTSYNVDKAKVSANSIDLNLNFFFWRFFKLGVGYSLVKADEEIKISNINGDPTKNFSYKDSVDYSGVNFNAALVLPLFRQFHLWIQYQARNWSTDDTFPDDQYGFVRLGYDISQLSLHGVYYFDP